MSTVAVFRHQLFKFSEPFIAQQAQRLTAFKPVYIGRERHGPAPESATSVTLVDRHGGNITLRRIRATAWPQPAAYQAILGARRPALIHAHFGVDAVYALALAESLGVPLVTTFHGFDATLSRRALLAANTPSWLVYLLRRRMLARRGDLFICVSDYIRERVLALGFPPKRTVKHYIGVDVHAVQPAAPADGRPTLVHVARLVEKKGTAYLLRAFARLGAAAGKARLVIIGEGPRRGALEALATQLGIGHQVEFRGRCPHQEVMDAIRTASVLVQPSVTAKSGDAEGLGMVLLEAAAAGVPVVASRHGGMPEAVAHGRTGLLVPERDSRALAEAIESLLADPAKRRAFGAAARTMCEANFDIRCQTRALEDHYRSVLE